ncbi:MAG: response regulator [Anaerolineae bacterium]|nr:response regulator [Anaerolineae bacterium]
MNAPRIFVVTEDKELASVIQKTLQARENFVVSTVADAQAAISLLKEFKPDMILLDYRLIQTEEIGLSVRIRRASSVPVLFLKQSDRAHIHPQPRERGNGHLPEGSQDGWVLRIQKALAKAGFLVVSPNVIL